MKKLFTGTFKQFGFIIKQERIISSVWVLLLAGTTAAVAAAYLDVFSSADELKSMAGLFSNPAMIAMLGPLYGGENITTAGLFSGSMLLFTVIAVAIMNIFLVLRYTRSDEERGRAEFVYALPVGRLSGLGAVLIAAVCINFILSLSIAALLAVVNMPGTSIVGALLYGLSLGVSGILFAAIAAVAAQVFSNSRGAAGFSMAVLGIMYLLRAAGDIDNQILSLITPLGLILRTQCFVENNWLPVFIILVLTAAIMGLALYLNSVRDLQQGLLPHRQGKGVAPKYLKSAEGLAFRLTANTIIVWAIALLVLGASYGSVMGDLESFIAGNEFLSQVLVPPAGHTQTEMFITLIISMLAVMAAIPAVGALTRLAAEEGQHRYENVFSKAVSRKRILTGYTIIALIESFFMLFCAMFGLWAASAAVMVDAISFGAMLKAFAVYIPAIWIMIGIAVLLLGAMPKKISVTVYSYLGFSFFILYMGRILQLPNFTKYLTPFGFIPQLPIESVSFLTLGLMSIAAIILSMAGYALYRRRDLH